MEAKNVTTCVIGQIVTLVERLDYLELSVLENAIQGRRWSMRQAEKTKFDSLEKLGA